MLLNSFAGGRPQRHPLGAVGRGEAGRNYVLTVQQAAARSAIRMAAGRGEDGRSCFLTVQQAAVRVAIRMAAGRGEDGRRSILQQPGASTRIKQIIGKPATRQHRAADTDGRMIQTQGQQAQI